MTEPSPPGEAADRAAITDQDEPPSPGPTPRLLGLTTFSIEGRRAPALFVVGWLATLVGLGLAFIGLQGPGGVVATVVWIAAALAWSLGLVMLAGSQSIERAAAGRTYAGPSPVLVFLAIVAISQLVGYVVGLPLSSIGDGIPRSLGDLIAVLLQAVVFIGVVRIVVVGTGALSWRQMGFTGGAGEAARGVLGGAVFAGPVILVTLVVAAAAVLIGGVTPPSPLPPTGTAEGLMLHLLAGAVVAPVAEEILFRGFALTAWRRTVGARGAIVRSSILFVLAHVLFVGGDTFSEAVSLAFVAGVVRLPVALALGWLFVRTGSLWVAIGLHGAFNAILITLGETAVGG